jgi:hypothetical protein
VAAHAKPRYVDIANPALAIDCPNCGLRTPRFLQYCRNDGYSLWPSSQVASAAFQAWRAADPARAKARRYDLVLPEDEGPPEVDFDAVAHRLGIHIFPSSTYPFPIAIGFFFLFLAIVHFPGEATWVRIGIFVVGALILLYGVIGWVVIEDTKFYPGDDTVEIGPQEAPHAGAGH